MELAAVVFDLDGVVRHWDPAVTAAIEARHGLERGAIVSTGFDLELGPAVVTGRLTYEEWLERVGERLGRGVAEEWQRSRGTVDRDAVALVEAVRATGLTVGLLSNGTTRLEEDLEVLGIAEHFDHVFNTARLGVCKPDPAVYGLVLEHLELAPEQVAFTDDTPGWATAAADVGMHGIVFTGVEELRHELRALGVAV